MDDTTTLDDASIPEGTAFLDLLWDRAEQCVEQTDKLLPQMGVKAPLCLSNIGTALSLLDRVSSCWWQCSNDDHALQYLVARAEGSTIASMSLLRAGYYDEALNATRRAGEIANLLFLFVNDRRQLDEWRSASETRRRSAFSPVKIRIKLQDRHCMVSIEEERYGQLSAVGTHVSPHTRPQAFNPENRAIVGGLFQEAGALVALNEVGVALAWVTVSCSRLRHLEEKERRRLLKAAVSLFRAIGGVTITDVAKLFAKEVETGAIEGEGNGQPDG